MFPWLRNVDDGSQLYSTAGNGTWSLEDWWGGKLLLLYFTRWVKYCIDQQSTHKMSSVWDGRHFVCTGRTTFCVYSADGPSPSSRLLNKWFLEMLHNRHCIVLLRYKKVACTRQQDLTFLRLRYTDNFTSWCLKIYIEVLKFWHFDINAVLWLGSILVRLGGLGDNFLGCLW